MKSKLINSLLILSSLIGYLEWGGNNQTFLFQAEADIIFKIFSEPKSLLHPFIVLPMLGQFLLFITLFQKNPAKILTYLGIGSLGLLLVFMFAIGIMTLNYKMIFYALPFIILSVYAIDYYRKINKQSSYTV